MLLRRAFAIYDVKERGVYGGTVEFVFAVHGKGTAWLAARRPQDKLDLVGPLGKPFRLPAQPVTATLVGGGYGSAPLLPLADDPARARLPGRLRARRRAPRTGCSASSTPSGSPRASRSPPTTARWAGSGRVSDVLPQLLDRTGVRRRLRLRADGDAASGHRPRGRARHPVPGRGRGVDGLRHRGLHDLRAAGHRRRRPDPHGPVLRRGAGVPRRPGPLGRRRHACRRTSSAPSTQGGGH